MKEHFLTKKIIKLLFEQQSEQTITYPYLLSLDSRYDYDKYIPVFKLEGEDKYVYLKYSKLFLKVDKLLFEKNLSKYPEYYDGKRSLKVLSNTITVEDENTIKLLESLIKNYDLKKAILEKEKVKKIDQSPSLNINDLKVGDCVYSKYDDILYKITNIRKSESNNQLIITCDEMNFFNDEVTVVIGVQLYSNRLENIERGDLISEQEYNNKIKEKISLLKKEGKERYIRYYNHNEGGKDMIDLTLEEFLENQPKYKSLFPEVESQVQPKVEQQLTQDELCNEDGCIDEEQIIDSDPNKKQELEKQISETPNLDSEKKKNLLNFLKRSNKTKVSDFLYKTKSMNINKGDGIFEKLTDFLREKFPKHVKKETLILDRCEDLINKFYNKYLIYYNKYKNNKNDNTNKDLPKTLSDLNNDYELTTEIQNEKSVVQRCVGTYQKKFNNKTNNKINQLTNITPDLEKYFEIRRDIAESINIYNKNNDMSISNSIRKVLKEQSEKTKSVLVEKEIIENKINYIFNSTNKINKKSVVIKESNNLLNMGYDKKLIKEVAKKYLN